MLKHVIGEWSAVLRQYLRRQLLGPGGLMSGGLALEVHGEPKKLHGRLANLLTDGDGWRDTFGWKGHASLKPSSGRQWQLVRACWCGTAQTTINLQHSPRCSGVFGSWPAFHQHNPPHVYSFLSSRLLCLCVRHGHL